MLRAEYLCCLPIVSYTCKRCRSPTLHRGRRREGGRGWGEGKGGGDGGGGATAPQLQKLLKFFEQNADDLGKSTREERL